MNKLYDVFLPFCFFFFFLGCTQEQKESPTKGTLTFYSSDAIAPLVNGEVTKFHNLYSEAFISNIPTSDREAIAQLLNDSTNCIVIARSLNEEERDVAKKKSFEITEHLFAYDATAFIVNKKNPIEQLRKSQLDSIFSGTITHWNTLSTTTTLQQIRIALLNRNFGLYQILSKQLLHGKEFTQPDILAQSTSDVIDFVGKNIDAIGFMSVSWKNVDTTNIQILRIQHSTPPDSLKKIAEKFYFPYQYYIWNNYYPFVHSVYIYTHNIGFGVGAGFVTFLLSAHPGEGQKIVGDYGLVPARMPIRIVQTQKKPLQ
ncbi:MAG: hypothetical protein FJ218_00755 [Ignavibacteria bacterium]|nr:hypothetical protein [Ignavibacteria bacterium]